MVSPPYKAGNGVSGVAAVEPGGESVVFFSHGGFAGALAGGTIAEHEYLARRGSSDWSTASFEPAFGGVSDMSASLEYALASGPLGPNAGVENFLSTEEVFQLHRADMPDTPESWEVFGGMVLKRLGGGHFATSEVGASPDLCHLALAMAEGAMLPEAVNSTGQIYDFARSCGSDQPSLRLVGVTNNEVPTPINRSCPVALGTGQYLDPVNGNGQESSVNAVDAHGDEIFFTTSVSTGCYIGEHPQLFVRLGGARTVEVSRALEAGPFGGCVAKKKAGEVPCEGALTRAGAYFKGASEDGSRVFFSTIAQLTGEDKDGGNDLYMATIGCPGASPEAQSCEPSRREVTSLVQVSHDPNAGEPANVQGVVRVATDGSHVYFVARGVLSGGPNAQGEAPVSGADNLYVYDSVSGTTAFIAGLCSGPGRSGAVEDRHCPRGLTEGEGDAGLWRSSIPQAQATADGAFMVFDSYAQLLPGDTDSAKDVYRYDAQTDTLERVSMGENYYDANGNNDKFDASIRLGVLGSNVRPVSTQHEMATHAISADGSRIVFDTAESLSPAATNGKANIYEWDEGGVSLVSSGTAEEDDGDEMITASGRDIIFKTIQGLVGQDSDGQPDVYDARIGGGFPPLPAERQRCSGDGCQGPLTNPTPLLVPGSVSQAPGGNFAAPLSKSAVKAKKSKRRKRRFRNKRRAVRRPGRTSAMVEGGRR
jgi:hypothetical protein